jgi:ATP-dependent DNA helicase RecG
MSRSATAQASPAARSSPPPTRPPTLFASRSPATREQLLAAPLRWPRPSRLGRSLPVAPGKLADGLKALELTNVGKLLEHLPTDSRDARTISGLRADQPATVAVQVRSIAVRPVKRRGMRPLVEASVFDETGRMRATFFNQPWLATRYKPGTRLLLHGKLSERGTFNVAHHALGQDLHAHPAFALQAPSSSTLDELQGFQARASRDGAGARENAPDGEGAVAHYQAAEGVSSTQILTLVRGARDALKDVPDALDAKARVCEQLPDRASALAAMHFGRTAAERETGRERLAFEELLLAQLVFLRRRQRRSEGAAAPRLDQEPSLSARWLERELPFALTSDQRRAIAAIAEDLTREQPMQRLLLGEVGSGKTVVAAWALLRAVEHGMQAALMAPTETLAEQHFATLQQLLGAEQANVRCALLTGSTKARRREDTLAKLASGELALIVGTHALIEPEVSFRALAVAVIDEQHRFGVRQRSALARIGDRDRHAPHVLHMTATPIPRTLALANYGDLDVTTLRELPGGRQPIDTRIVSGEAERARAYEELRSELRAGRQAYVVCPLIEHPDESGGPGSDAANGEPSKPGGGGQATIETELRAATAELARLKDGELQEHCLALLHGGMRPSEKAQAMARFAAGAADVLVSTTVIEVGIDVANATTMLIENAERFGIAQLHQLRGRVGRGEHRSRCLLMGPPAAARLRALVEHSDGFELAEIDLRLRNEGELIGVRQSGAGQYRIARLPDDGELLERARARAQAIMAADPSLQLPEHVLLGEALEQAFGAEAFEPIPG